MARKEDFLKTVCERLYGKGNHLKPSLDQIKYNGKLDEVKEVYKSLGGILETPPVNTGTWDIDLESLIIELDEENHFNRYRLITLDAPTYMISNNFNVEHYRKYCRSYEKKCPTTQKRWTNPSAEKQFGESGAEGDFSGNGPARWKQRAFYDYLKDLYSEITGVPVLRISIYDQVGYSTIKQLLDDENSLKIREHIMNLVDHVRSEF